MLAALLLAAAPVLSPPLAVWPAETGPAMTVVDEVEIYVAEPEIPYYLLAVQVFPTPLRTGDAPAVKRLAALATKLGAEAVVLLGEMPEASIPDDVQKPLPTSGRVAGAAFVVFDACDQCPEEGTRRAVLPPGVGHPSAHVGLVRM
ncbi:MAG TPA: hypothetical protein PLS53_04405 [Thermoanaerobaculaceae bacterium]|nr:hypothetical protein [Thermoanaerobaculaceae bacterium]HPS77379.1 hypothetical protein [Thermoanaerobaculaceae bacterium]